MIGRGEVIEVSLDGDIPHAIAHRDGRAKQIEGDVALVFGVQGDHAPEEHRRKHVRPAPGQGLVAPAIAKGQGVGTVALGAVIAHADVEVVVAPIRAEHEVVVGTELGIYLGVDIVKPVAEAIEFVGAPPHRPQHGIDVCAPTSHHPRALAERPLAHKPAGDQANAAAGAKVAAIAIAILHIEDSTQAAAVLGWIGPLVEGDVFDRVRVEGGEKTKSMRRIVEPHLVEQDAGLVGAAAAHVESTAKIRCRLHARQQLQTAQQVRLGHGRHLLYVRYLQGDHARPLVHFSFRRGRLGLHDDLPHLQRLSLQFDIPAQRLASGQRQRIAVGCVANVGRSNDPSPGRDVRDGVIAFGVAQRTHCSVFNGDGDRGIGQALAVAAVADKPAEGTSALRRLGLRP